MSRPLQSSRTSGNGAEPRGVLFDVDGTLVDTNYLHAVCWWEALRQAGYVIPMARIHRGIGMGSDKLLEDLLGRAPEPALHDALAAGHTALYLTYVGRLEPLPGARDLLATCAERGMLVVLASSASKSELGVLRRALDADDYVDGATSASDVDDSKPSPDILQAAVAAADLDLAEVVFVGDSVWDVHAAKKLGIECIGLTCGGTAEAELSEAGAQQIFEDPADLLDHFDSSLLAERSPTGSPL
jgi:HAD superfamily hydrolase (TIGR01509 family)